jgi:hypothetical protein
MVQGTKDKPSCDGGALMKRIRFVCTGVLLLLLGITAPIYANPQKGQDKKEQGQNKQPQGQARQQPERAQQQPQGQTRQQPQRAQQQPQGQTRQQPQRAQRQPQGQTRQQPQRAQRQPQAGRPSQQGQRVQGGEQRGVWQQHRANNWQAEHRTWQQRGGYNGYRIPETRFRSYFGPSHWFRIYSYPLVMFGGYPRFRYGDFWFSLLDPWPEYWSDNWYDNDDVYIDYYGDGYYLYNRRYPRDRIAISISLN